MIVKEGSHLLVLSISRYLALFSSFPFLSTYPQGDAVILPQILTVMAAFSTIMAFPVLTYQDGEWDFICIQVETDGGSSSTECTGLFLNQNSYWNNDDTKGWASALRAATMFGIFAAVAGVLAATLWTTATCFVMKPVRLLTILIMLAVGAFGSIFTLIGGVADVCKAKNLDNCSRENVRVETGAGFMIAAFLLYIASGVLTGLMYLQVKKEMTPMNPQETEKLVIKPIQATLGPPAAPPVAAPGGVTVTKTVNPDGTTRIEREFVDADGQLVKEISIEEEV